MRYLPFLLLLFKGLSPVSAQEMHNPVIAHGTYEQYYHNTPLPKEKMEEHHRYDYARSGYISQFFYYGWYNLWECNLNSTSKYFAWPIYPDSNIIDDFSPMASTPYQHIHLHGMGVTFDPTDSAYGPSTLNYWDTLYFHGGPPFLDSTWFQLDTFSYLVDSIGFFYHYIRNNTAAVGDSMIVEICRSQVNSFPDSGCQRYQVGADSHYRNICADSMIRFASLRYDNSGSPDDCLDSVIMPIDTSSYRWAVSLDNILVDTIAGTGGDLYFQSPIFDSRGIRILPGTNLVVYVYFKSGVHYPPGTLLSTANCLYLYAGDPVYDRWFHKSAHNNLLPYPGSYQSVLLANDDIRYNDTGFAFNGHNVLVPTGYYAQFNDSVSPGFDVMAMGFFTGVSSGGGSSTGIGNQQEQKIQVNANPNPANDKLRISFQLPTAEPVSVNIYDLSGQIIATRKFDHTSKGVVLFDVLNFPNGSYLYSVVSGNDKSMGHFEVLH